LMASVGSGLPSHKSTIVKQLMSNGIIKIVCDLIFGRHRYLFVWDYLVLIG
jgi:hypothetical protein